MARIAGASYKHYGTCSAQMRVLFLVKAEVCAMFNFILLSLSIVLLTLSFSRANGPARRNRRSDNLSCGPSCGSHLEKKLSQNATKNCWPPLNVLLIHVRACLASPDGLLF